MEFIGALRDRCGPEMGILFDVGQEYRMGGIVQLGRALEPFNLYWLEAEGFDPDALLAARRQTRTRICHGEALIGKPVNIEWYLHNQFPGAPIQDAGRLENFNPATDRLTLTEVRRKILDQSSVFRPEDIIPVPCHPDSLAMAYALKLDGKVTPLTSMIPPEVLINGAANTILYEQDPSVRTNLFKLFATNHSPKSGAGTLRELLCCLPKVFVADDITYENIFRIIIMQFIDAHSFDVRSVKKTCVHIVHPDGRLIPFDTYNLFYRDELETTRLAPLRQNAELALAAI